MSIVVLEAGATGSAVLMTDQCGFDDVARVGGGMVVPASVSGLQDGLVQLLRHPARLKHMGARLREHVSENFTWDSVGSKYLSLFRDILRRDLTRA
jgi:glycosyltransferase involved in cell wall biosynthesis